MALTRRSTVATTALLLVACSSIPNITFVDDVDGSGPKLDGGIDAAAQPDAVQADAAVDGQVEGCPTRVPSFAQVCCGSVPCSGQCADECSACAAKCGPTEACCAKRNNVVCRSREGFTCN